MKVKAFGFVLEEKENSNKFGSVSCSKSIRGDCSYCCYQIVSKKHYSEDNCLIRYLREKNNESRGNEEYNSTTDSDIALSRLITDNLVPINKFEQISLDF